MTTRSLALAHAALCFAPLACATPRDSGAHAEVRAATTTRVETVAQTSSAAQPSAYEPGVEIRAGQADPEAHAAAPARSAPVPAPADEAQLNAPPPSPETKAAPQAPASASSQQASLAEKTVPPSQFELALQAARDAQDVVEKAQAKTRVDGDYAAFLAALAAAAPARERDAAQALAYGEALWPYQPTEAATVFESAFALAPNEPAVLLAHARVLHMRGRHAEAAQAYAQAGDALKPASLATQALRVDALLNAGDVAAAAQAWQRSGVITQIAQIERDEARPSPLKSPRPSWYQQAELDLRAIHGRTSPERTRMALLAKIRAGDDALLEELVVNDCFWTGTHDYANSNRAYLKRDVDLVLERTGKDSRRYVEASYLARGRMRIEPNAIQDMVNEPELPSGGESLPPSNIEREGKKLGFVGTKKYKHFPISSRTAPIIYRMLFMDGVTISVEWLDTFDEELFSRARSEKGDADIAVFILDLYREAIDRKFPTWEPMPAKREVFEKEVWARYKDPRIAQRILGRRAKDLASDDPVLVEALGLFPQDLELAQLSLDALRREGKPLGDALVRVAKAALADGKLLVAAQPLAQLESAAKPSEPKDGAK